MADIDVERERRSIWPWILGLLALLLLIWLLVELFDRDREDVAVAPVADTAAMVAPAPVIGPDTVGVGVVGNTAAGAAAPQAVQAFASACVGSSDAQNDMGMMHSYTQRCIRQMTEAVAAVVGRDTVGGQALSARLQTLRTEAARLDNNAQSTRHADIVHNVFTQTADLLNQVQEQRRYGGSAASGAVSQVRTAAQAIRPGTELLNQKAAVGTFFQRAADALRMMAM